MSFRFIILTLLLAVVPGACMPATTILPSPQPPAQLPATQLPTKRPAESPSVSETAPALQPASGWMEYRDARYAYALALPCYWTVYPTPSDGMFATLSAHSYSEQFFTAHSERNEWKGGIWPAGAYKFDATVIEAVDPSLSLEDAIRYLFTTPSFASEQELVSLEPVTFGTHQAFLATVQGGLQGAEPTRSVYFQLEPGTLLIFTVLPQEAFDQPDIQAILGSFATPEEQVSFPSREPSGPPDGSPISCQ